MKKLFIILLFLLISCKTTTRMFYIIDKSYTDYEYAVNDVYNSLKITSVDSLNIYDWIRSTELKNDSLIIDQKILLSDQNKTKYNFIFTTYTILKDKFTDSSYYTYKVRCETKDKKIWPQFK